MRPCDRDSDSQLSLGPRDHLILSDGPEHYRMARRPRSKLLGVLDPTVCECYRTYGPTPEGRRYALLCSDQITDWVPTSERGPPACDPRRTADLGRRDQRLLSELRRKSVHVHLVVLVVRPWSNRAFNYLTHSVDRFTFPDADAEVVIVGSRMDWQRNVRRKPSFECLGLGGLKAFGIVNSVDDCHEHGITVHSSR